MTGRDMRQARSARGAMQCTTPNLRKGPLLAKKWLVFFLYEGYGGEVQKVHFMGPEELRRSTFWGSHTSPKLILATGLL